MLKRLYFFTGKGGTGKSLLCMAFAQLLKSEAESSHKIKIISLEPPEKANNNIHTLDLESSIKKYLSIKLGQLVARGILKTPFFSSALQMAPGFHYLVYLGDMLYQLKDDPNLIILFDCPSSGHTLTLFQSLSIFKKIFQKGILYEDIIFMEKMLMSKDFYQIIVCGLADPIPMIESLELKEKLIQLKYDHIKIYINRTFAFYPSLNSLPNYWKNRIQQEKDFFIKYKNSIYGHVNYIPEINNEKLLSTLAQELSPLL